MTETCQTTATSFAKVVARYLIFLTNALNAILLKIKRQRSAKLTIIEFTFMESAKNANPVRNRISNGTNEISNINKKCQFCKAGFEVWLSTLNFNFEREERIREHFLKYCPECQLLDEKEGEAKTKKTIVS